MKAHIAIAVAGVAVAAIALPFSTGFSVYILAATFCVLVGRQFSADWRTPDDER